MLPANGDSRRWLLHKTGQKHRIQRAKLWIHHKVSQNHSEVSQNVSRSLKGGRESSVMEFTSTGGRLCFLRVLLCQLYEIVNGFVGVFFVVVVSLFVLSILKQLVNCKN